MIKLKQYKPHQGQLAFHWGIQNMYRFVLLLCGIRGGKCLSIDQDVLMSNGSLKRAGDLKVNDEILGFEQSTGISTPTKITYTEKTFKPTARYTLSDGSQITCSTDHAFPVWNIKRSEFIELPITEIVKRSDNYLYLLGSRITHFNNKKELSIHPYLLGVILGDGGITQNSCVISTKDEEIVEACEQLSGLEMRYNSGADYRLSSNQRCEKGYNTNQIVTKLRALDLIGCNSYTKFIPDHYKTSSVGDRLDLLAGLIDTDGTVNDKGQIEYYTCSKALADGVLFILRSLGIRASIRNKIGKYKDKEHFSFRIKWTDNLGIPLKVKRKADRVINRVYQRSDTVYIEKEEFIGLRPCVDISIDHPSHLFLLDNFIATHNTYAGAREAIKQAWNSECKKDIPYGIIAPTYHMLDRTTWREFKSAAYPLIAKENDSKKIITLKNGREVFGFSAENYDRIRNVTLCGFWVDEGRECKDFSGLWDVLLGRVLSTAGKGIVTSSPNSYDDMYNIFIQNRKSDYGTVRFTTFENTTLDKSLVEDLASKYDEKFARQEIYGDIVSFEGAVYYAFNRNYNAGDLAFEIAQYDPNKKIILCCDFNVNPMAWVLVQIHNHEGMNKICVIDEIFLPNSNTFDACSEFKARYPNHFSGVVLYGDATGKSRSTQSNKSNYQIIEDELKDYVIDNHVKSGNPAERDRINAVNSMLCNSKKQRNILVNPRCKNIIRDFEQVSFKDGSVRIDKEKDSSLTHISDAFGYFIESEFSLLRDEIKGLKI